MLGVTLNQTIDLTHARNGDAEQIVSEASHFRTGGAMLSPERAPDVLRILLAHIGLKQHLQYQFARFAPSTHEQLSVISGQLPVYCKEGLSALLWGVLRDALLQKLALPRGANLPLADSGRLMADSFVQRRHLHCRQGRFESFVSHLQTGA